MPGSELIKSDITLYCSDRRLHTVIGAIPVDITVRGSKGNTSRQLLHIVSELSTLSISKVCLQELGIISESFPLHEKVLETVDAMGKADSSTLLPSTAPCGCLTHKSAPEPLIPDFPVTEGNVPRLTASEGQRVL